MTTGHTLPRLDEAGQIRGGQIETRRSHVDEIIDPVPNFHRIACTIS